MLEEFWMDMFTNSLIDAAIQDGDKRERNNDIVTDYYDL